MTKLVKTVIVVVMVVVVAMTMFNATNNTKTMTVSEVRNDEVFVIDENGNEWSFFGDGYEVGESINVVMDNGCIVDVVE